VLTARLAKYHFTAGFTFLALSFACKDFIPFWWGSSFFIQGPCAFFSAVFLPLGSLFALVALMTRQGNSREMIGYHLAAIAAMIIPLGIYFYTYALMEKVLHLPEPMQVFPRLVENAQNVPKEDVRKKEAQIAYRISGASIAYRLDNNQQALYEPTDEDRTYFLKWKKSEGENQYLRGIIEKATGQYPYLFGLYLGTLLSTYLIGGVWIYFKKSIGLNPPVSVS
jgi:hypothetical protein